MITRNKIKFHKYHGAGNDFIMINNLDGTIKLKSDYIAKICDRNFGIGADGLILIEKQNLIGNPNKAMFFMNYYNSDGSTAEMCGNGIRCAVKFFLSETKKTLKMSKVLPCSVLVKTRAGFKEVKVNEDNTYSVNMGLPIFKHQDFPKTLKLSKARPYSILGYKFNCVSTGNPHAVALVENLDEIDVKNVGPKIETNSLFPNKINVEFVEKISNNHYKVRVWERGCGETFACGTGACAVFSIIDKLATKKIPDEKEMVLEFPGGKLYLSKNHEGEIILRGPATFVFKGEIN